MAILLTIEGRTETVSKLQFESENDLQKLLAENPLLLQDDAEASLAFVKREVSLGSSGYLDLLMVDSDGVPVAVEVKLHRNSQSRREVVAQAIDYIAALTDMTVDELEEETDAQLSQALRSFDEDDTEFERRWRAVGANLRAGLARLVVAADGTNPGLERMLRFLAEKSELDVQLVVVEQSRGIDGQKVFVGRQTFTRASVSETRSAAFDNSRLLDAVDNYNRTAVTGLKAIGIASNYRQIRPPTWPPGCRTHYEFYQTKSYIGAEIHIESDFARPLAAILSPLAGTTIGPSNHNLIWDGAWSNGRGRLTVRFSHEDDPSAVAVTMTALIERTFSALTAKLAELTIETASPEQAKN